MSGRLAQSAAVHAPQSVAALSVTPVQALPSQPVSGDQLNLSPVVQAGLLVPSWWAVA